MSNAPSLPPTGLPATLRVEPSPPGVPDGASRSGPDGASRGSKRPPTIGEFLHLHRYRIDGWTPAKVAAFIEVLGATGRVTRAADYVGMTPAAAYRLRNRPGAEPFAEAWEAAIGARHEMLADIAMARIEHGVERIRWWRGEKVGVDHLYSDRLLMFMLAATNPDRARGGDRAPAAAGTAEPVAASAAAAVAGGDLAAVAVGMVAAIADDTAAAAVADGTMGAAVADGTMGTAIANSSEAAARPGAVGGLSAARGSAGGGVSTDDAATGTPADPVAGALAAGSGADCGGDCPEGTCPACDAEPRVATALYDAWLAAETALPPDVAATMLAARARRAAAKAADAAIVTGIGDRLDAALGRPPRPES